MIRLTAPDDAAAILNLAVEAGMFPANETDALSNVLANYFGGKLHDGHTWISDEEAGELRGVIYYAPDVIADRTWYIYMIAVHPNFQGQGRGAALMQHVETTLQNVNSG